MKEIVLAGGCFWGVAEYYRRLKGVVDTETGYANGNQDTVSYEAVCTGKTGHAEVVKIKYEIGRASWRERVKISVVAGS